MSRLRDEMLAALRSAAETADDGWGSVYLDNVKRQCTPRQFAQRLSMLARAGLYRYEGGEYRGVWGYVRSAK